MTLVPSAATLLSTLCFLLVPSAALRWFFALISALCWFQLFSGFLEWMSLSQNFLAMSDMGISMCVEHECWILMLGRKDEDWEQHWLG
ncbi:hypothetical protein ERO13_D08G139240v2 [Gossypium hirsutum]|nr:hypothetical protein ERO13_D08G139240v2 [Gossypium hirsutum]